MPVRNNPEPMLDGPARLLYGSRLAGRRNLNEPPRPLDFSSEQRKGLLVNVTVENLAPCKKLVRVEVETQKVDEALDRVTKDFQREASLPGFRPGKAPREMVLRKYSKDIEEEAKRKLISEAYKQAVDEQKLDVVGYPDIEEIQFTRGQPLQFAATLETAPEFELPEYKGLPAKVEARSVTDADVESRGVHGTPAGVVVMLLSPAFECKANELSHVPERKAGRDSGMVPIGNRW